MLQGTLTEPKSGQYWSMQPVTKQGVCDPAWATTKRSAEPLLLYTVEFVAKGVA